MRRSIVTALTATAVTMAACSGFNDDGMARSDASVAAKAAPASVGITDGAQAERIAVAPPAAAPAPTQFSAVARQDPFTSMVIRTGQASVEVESLPRAIADLRSLALRAGGYVSNTTMQAGEEQLREATVELKIPANRFDEVRDGLTGLGELKGLTEASQDVGEEYVDIAARVENSRRLESRLVALLATRTGKLDEVLTVERELGRIREEIERAEGRMRYLRARVSFSTLTVSVFEPRPVIVRGGRSVIGRAFDDAWRNLVGFIAAMIAALGFLIPLGALVGLGWVGVAVIRRRFPTTPVLSHRD